MLRRFAELWGDKSSKPPPPALPPKPAAAASAVVGVASSAPVSSASASAQDAAAAPSSPPPTRSAVAGAVRAPLGDRLGAQTHARAATASAGAAATAAKTQLAYSAHSDSDESDLVDVAAADDAQDDDDVDREDEFVFLFDPRESTEPGESVQDDYGFTVDRRSAGMYLAAVQDNNAALAAQADSFDHFLCKMQSETDGGAVALVEYGWRQYKNHMVLLIREGVPRELRPIVWLVTSGARQRRAEDPERYTRVQKEYAGMVSQSTEQIDKDVGRTFPDHPAFADAEGRERLRRVLVAYAWANQHIGYCQGMNFVVGMLLLFVGEEDAFWIMHTIAESLALDYYGKHMVGVEADIQLLRQMMSTYCPRVVQHMEELEADLTLNCFRWLPCLGVGSFPSEFVLRIWDEMFAEGQVAFLRAIVALYKAHQEALLATADTTSLLRVMEAAARCAFRPNEVLRIGHRLVKVTADEFRSMRKETHELVMQRRERLIAARRQASQSRK